MRNLYYLLFITVLIFSCAEDNLMPSDKDVDRVATQIDLSKPLIKYLYENYNSGILYEFHDTLDFIYTEGKLSVAQAYDNVELGRLHDTLVDDALMFLDESLFSYFKDTIEFNGRTYKSDFIKQKFPFKILICNGIDNESSMSLNSLNTESDNRATSNGRGRLHCLGNKHSFAFNTDIETLNASSSTYKKFKTDNFYIFISHIMGESDLYNVIPPSFYSYSNYCYEKNIGDIYEVDGNELTGSSVQRVEESWYNEKGFVRPKNMRTSELGVGKNFIGKEYDVRTYLNEMIFGRESEYKKYPDVVKNKFKILTETFMSWGIDIVSFNPALAVLFND